MKLHCLLHADFQQPNYLIAWAQQHNLKLDITYVHKNKRWPTMSDFDALLIMGGPQSTHQTTTFPYLLDEINFIKHAIEASKFILGVCLGAQLLGVSYGAPAEPSPHKEIGVFPVSLTPAGRVDPLFMDFPDTFDTGHWHSEMPGLPECASIIASSKGCPRQIIRFSEKVYGFQCHMELNQSSIQTLIQCCPNDLQNDLYIQNEAHLLKQDWANINKYLGLFLKKLLLS